MIQSSRWAWGRHILTDASCQKADKAEPRTFSAQNIVLSTATIL
ncbi:MAG: hypothetical protein ACLQGU_12325 [bacterium]